MKSVSRCVASLRERLRPVAGVRTCRARRTSPCPSTGQGSFPVVQWNRSFPSDKHWSECGPIGTGACSFSGPHRSTRSHRRAILIEIIDPSPMSSKKCVEGVRHALQNLTEGGHRSMMSSCCQGGVARGLVEVRRASHHQAETVKCPTGACRGTQESTSLLKLSAAGLRGIWWIASSSRGTRRDELHLEWRSKGIDKKCGKIDHRRKTNARRALSRATRRATSGRRDVPAFTRSSTLTAVAEPVFDFHGAAIPKSPRICSEVIRAPDRQMGTPVPGWVLAPTKYVRRMVGWRVAGRNERTLLKERVSQRSHL